MVLNKNIKLIFNYFLGPLVFIFLCYSIYRQIQHQHHWKESFLSIKNAITGEQQWKVVAVVLLMLLNWGLEAKKWQLAISHLQTISFIRAFKAILTGTTMASFTPNRMGEYLGRLLYVEEGKRIQSISLSIICSIAQLIITLFAGCLGIVFLRHHLLMSAGGGPQIHFWLNILLGGSIIALLILTIFYFRLSWLVRLFEKMALPRYSTNIAMLEVFGSSLLLRVLLLSAIRFLVFMVQYYLLFSVFGVTISWIQTLAGMSVVFLVMAVVPTFTFLTDLGLRWEASIQVIEFFSNNTVGIFAASFGIWLVNLIIPALVGSLLILGIKLFRNR